MATSLKCDIIYFRTGELRADTTDIRLTGIFLIMYI